MYAYSIYISDLSIGTSFHLLFFYAIFSALILFSLFFLYMARHFPHPSINCSYHQQTLQIRCYYHVWHTYLDSLKTSLSIQTSCISKDIQKIQIATPPQKKVKKILTSQGMRIMKETLLLPSIRYMLPVPWYVTRIHIRSGKTQIKQNAKIK